MATGCRTSLGAFPALLLLGAIAAQVPVVSGLPSVPPRWEKGARTRAAATRIAVVVAADAYEHHAAWALPTARASAELLRDALVQRGGFSPAQVTVLSGRDVHQESVRSAVAGAGERAGSGQPALLYVHWVGHGWVEGGEPSLFGYYTDESGASFRPAITRRQLVQWVNEAVARAAARGAVLQPVLALDACRVPRGAPPPRARLVQSSVFEIYGSKDGELVAAGQGGEGFAFTAALASAIEATAARDGDAALDVVFREARDRTLRSTGQRQEPVLFAPAAVAVPKLLARPRVGFALRTVDALSGARVESAQVRLDDTEHAVSDAGAALSTSPGDHVLTVSAEGFLPRTEALTLLREQEDAELTLPLFPALVVVRGRFVPPAALAVRARCGAEPRGGYHVHAATASAEGRFELRLAGTTAAIEIVHKGHVLQALELPPPTMLGRDEHGVLDAIPVIEVTVPVAASVLAIATPDALAGIQAEDRAAPRVEPNLDNALDRADWQRAKTAIARGRFDVARDDLRGIASGDAELRAWRAWVDRRWAQDVLERALRTGVAAGDFAGVDEVREWLDAAGADAHADLRRLHQEVERERLPLAARVAFNSANAALAAGELEMCLQSYCEARTGANAHYAGLIDAQIAAVRDRLYERAMRVGARHEVDGDLAGAFGAYATALRYSERARAAVARVQADPRLPATPAVQALRDQVTQVAPAPRPSPPESKVGEPSSGEPGGAAGKTTTYESLSFRSNPEASIDARIALAEARERNPNGTDIFESMSLSLGTRRNVLVRCLETTLQAQVEASRALAALGSAYDALLAAGDAEFVERQRALAVALADCRTLAKAVEPALAAAGAAADDYFPAWSQRTANTLTTKALRGLMTQHIAGRRATVDAATRAVQAADATLARTLASLEEQLRYAADTPAVLARRVLRSRRTVLADGAAALATEVEAGAVAVRAAIEALQRAKH